MRIALFSGNYNYVREGANQALNKLASYLETKAGHQVRAYSPVTATPAFEPAGTLVPVPSVALPVRSEFRLALGLPRSARRDLKCFRPDIVHVSTPDLLGARAQTFARRSAIPLVASLHTRFEAYLEHYRLAWMRPALEAHLRRFYRRCDHVLVPTAALAEEMMELRGDDRVSVWSRGVDRRLFDPARRDRTWRQSRGLTDDEFVILFFGRLVLEKGVGTFVSVVRELQRRRMRVRALIVGAGPAGGMFEALPGAMLTGHLDGPDLARAVASAEMMLHPSTTETFGNVVLEAMASGLVVVAANAPGARSLIADGRTGILCPPEDVECYASAVSALIAAPDRLRKMGAAARAASEAYSWDEASASVERCYQRLVAEAGREEPRS